MAKTTALANYDAEMAKYAQAYAGQEAGVGGGSFFSIRGGKLSLDGSTIPNNELSCVILDSINENIYYGADYDPDAPASPQCYAFGRADKEMCPHADAPKKVSAKCAGCPNNEFGSADKGRGKACKNKRRLALISAGAIVNGKFEAPENLSALETARVAYLAIPPTQLKEWAGYVNRLKEGSGRPPFGVYTRIRVEPDPKTQIAIKFEVLGLVPNSIWPVMVKRHEEAAAGIAFPYQVREEPARVKKTRKF